MNKKIIIIVAVVAVALIALFALSGMKSNDTTPPQDNTDDTQNTGETKTFVLTGQNFKFTMDGVDNPDIVVNQGDRVRIEFSSAQGFHDWVVDEFNAATDQVRDTDGSTFVEFVADRAGTFEYYCSVGQHRANGMRGNLIVQ